MNYLITGGTGLIGRNLVAKLLIKQENITILTRDKNEAKKLFSSKVTFIDCLSADDVDHNDIVINLAGEAIAGKRWSATQKTKICTSRWALTEQIATLIQASKSPPKLFISGSAIGIYGKQNNQVIKEGFTNYHPDFTHKVCQQWEDIALTASSNKTRVALLRTGIVLAKNKGALSKMNLPFSLGLGGKIGDGEQVMSWIHINDMVNAIIHIIDHQQLDGPINLTATHPVSNKVFSKSLADALNRPCLLTTPAMMMKIIFGEMADILLFGQNVHPAKLSQSGYTFEYPTIDRAFNEIYQ